MTFFFDKSVINI